MLIDKWKKEVLTWIKEGYKFKKDKEGRFLMYLEGHRAVPISRQSYWFAMRVTSEMSNEAMKQKGV